MSRDLFDKQSDRNFDILRRTVLTRQWVSIKLLINKSQTKAIRETKIEAHEEVPREKNIFFNIAIFVGWGGGGGDKWKRNQKKSHFKTPDGEENQKFSTVKFS